MKGTYQIFIEGYDFGCAVHQVMLNIDECLDDFDYTDIKIIETRQVCDFSDPTFPVYVKQFERTILDGYLCDDDLNKIKSSNKILLKLEVKPDVGNPLVFSMNTQLNTYSDPYTLEFSSKKYQFEIEKEYSKKISVADAFKQSTFTSSDYVHYDYLYYLNSSDTLVVWLHGLGEGATEGSDAYIPVLANKVTALIKDFQKIIPSHILVPQCPTYWMDQDGKKSNFNLGQIITDTNSFYTSSLNELIDDYVKKYDIKKVVLAGCSNGGYMTLVMGMTYPQKYKALVPICEAVPDATISDEQIENLKDTPIFFIYSKDDQIVDPNLHEIPTIQRLKEIGGKVHVSTSEHVIDTSRKYDIDNQPYLYQGHWSWIYFDNNESYCDECQISAWDFIKQSLETC